jgi:putative endonuclease
LKLLVFLEQHEDIQTAIQREKTMKHWPRAWKINVIKAKNPDWEDLYEKLA